jgi:transposase
VRFALESFREVYKIDAEAREKQLSPQDRLKLHQDKSAPWMKGLKNWIKRHLLDGRIEENSALGSAAAYLQEHWGPLTLFLRVEGAPLDNSLCERALKRMIIFRKNSMFYRTLNGARVGDIFTSLIHTAELNGVQPFEYLVAVLQHAKASRLHPERWMPWTYQQTLAQMPAPA